MMLGTLSLNGVQESGFQAPQKRGFVRLTSAAREDGSGLPIKNT